VDVRLPSGRLALALSGPDRGPLVVCVPGITANLCAFAPLAEHLAGLGLRVAAVDLRGRGHSEVTPRGTYGWPAHARDVIGVADALGAAEFAVVGHSMGAYVAMQAAALDAGRLRRVVLVDACGVPEESALPPIARAFDRLGPVFASPEEYVARIREVGSVEPWGPAWQRYYEYELEEVPGGVRARTSRDACVEDARWLGDHDPAALWPALTMPTLLVRAARPVVPGAGFIVGAELRDRFLQAVPAASLVEVDAGHYTVVTDSATTAAVGRFLT
jgi:pimeloyl-ACP methyl ester carboxylesterase